MDWKSKSSTNQRPVFVFRTVVKTGDAFLAPCVKFTRCVNFPAGAVWAASIRDPSCRRWQVMIRRRRSSCCRSTRSRTGETAFPHTADIACRSWALAAERNCSTAATDDVAPASGPPTVRRHATIATSSVSKLNARLNGILRCKRMTLQR